MRTTGNPQHFRDCTTMLSDEETTRVTAFVAKCPTLRAAQERLGMSAGVFSAARGYGRMLRATHARFMAALEREEAKVA